MCIITIIRYTLNNAIICETEFLRESCCYCTQNVGTIQAQKKFKSNVVVPREIYCIAVRSIILTKRKNSK